VVNYADGGLAFLAVIAWKKILGFGKKVRFVINWQPLVFTLKRGQNYDVRNSNLSLKPAPWSRGTRAGLEGSKCGLNQESGLKWKKLITYQDETQ